MMFVWNENRMLLLFSLICIAAFFLLRMLYRRIRQRRKDRELRQKNIRQIDRMSGEEFETLLAAHFRKQGYRVSLTPKSRDYGADLILQKNGKKIVVQAKRYSKKVGIQAIQEIISAREYYSAKRSMVCTNSYYTNSAKNLAHKCHVTLYDRESLTALLKTEQEDVHHAK